MNGQKINYLPTVYGKLEVMHYFVPTNVFIRK